MTVLAFAACANAAPWGVCAHLNRWEFDRAAEELKLIKQAGINFVRFDLDWNQVEPEPGKWNFERIDRIVELAATEGIMLLPILGGEIPVRHRPQYRHPEAWLAYVRSCVERYRGRIVYWEVMNEVNYRQFWNADPNPEEYVKMLQLTYEAVKKIDPALTVLHSGLAGVPEPFIERIFQAGGGNYFDVMNIHPYSWEQEPELTLPRRLGRLRALMTRYGLAEKPVWITEIGNSTGGKLPVKTIIQAAFRLLDRECAQTTLLLFADRERGFYSETQNFRVAEDLPRFKGIREIRVTELAVIDPVKYSVLLMPPTEDVPKSMIPALLNYLKQGGTVIFPAGFPLYFELNQSGRTQVGSTHMAAFHMGWNAWWNNQRFPRSVEVTEPGEAVPEIPGAKGYVGDCQRFMNEDNLRENDRLIPLLYGVKGDFRAPVAALYRFDSDLTGNAVVVTMKTNLELSSEEMQGKLLVRNALLARGLGAEKVFVYSFRSMERFPGRGEHFGIVRNNLEPKPAYIAYRTLTGLLGAEQVQLEMRGDLCFAHWISPGGERICALWSRMHPIKVSLDGDFREARSHLGEKLVFDTSGLVVTDAPIYLIGTKKMEFEECR